ncbi:hypothetical protein L9F63_017303 [Diploptera punctata]|uniref:U3 small nucleolar RNA-associated protein 20 domain-containing protein n=1 Tax=Diploptera punctata TaxID=6984 RepID=A0AAD7ZZY6_DIPPU|nr:hypothetical protein L9F63_017303 [Diploptera punctata]
MEYQKQLMRIVVLILDSFHFDLSRAEISELEVATKKNAMISNTQENLSNDRQTTPTEKIEDDNVIDNEDVVKRIEDAKPEELVEVFENVLDSENVVMNVEEEVKEVEVVKAIEKQTMLTKSVAMHVIQVITTGLLPQIHGVMAQMTPVEASHKLNKKQTASEKEEEGILQVPIALAAVKLLQRLPSYMLEQNLAGILMRLSAFLKSRLESIRRVTRDVRGSYQRLPSACSHLHNPRCTCLTQTLFQPGDIDCCLQSILELCKKDLFGDVAEEKEVNQITGKLHEARSTKSYDTFHILAQFITEKCFVDLLVPIREILSKTHSFKTIHNVLNV